MCWNMVHSNIGCAYNTYKCNVVTLVTQLEMPINPCSAESQDWMSLKLYYRTFISTLEHIGL